MIVNIGNRTYDLINSMAQEKLFNPKFKYMPNYFKHIKAKTKAIILYFTVHKTDYLLYHYESGIRIKKKVNNKSIEMNYHDAYFLRRVMEIHLNRLHITYYIN